MLVVSLVEEHIFAIASSSLPINVFKKTIRGNSVLSAQLLPELRSNLVAALAGLKRDNLARHEYDVKWKQKARAGTNVIVRVL